MTYEEAKNWLAKQPHHFCTLEEAELDQECRKVINEALEMRTPKKAYDVNRETISFDCPSCLSSLYAEDELENFGYCCVCGQSLDWSATE